MHKNTSRNSPDILENNATLICPLLQSWTRRLDNVCLYGEDWKQVHMCPKTRPNFQLGAQGITYYKILSIAVLYFDAEKPLIDS